MDYSEALQKAMAEVAKRKGKPESELVPWSDYDPIMIDYRVRELMHPGVRWAGD